MLRYKQNRRQQFGQTDSTNSYLYLQAHQEPLINQWLAALADCMPYGYAELSHNELREICDSFLTTFILALKSSEVAALPEWALRQQQVYRVSLSDIYLLISGLRRSLMAEENKIARVLALDVKFDQIAATIMEAVNNLPDKALEARIREMEGIAHELAAVTEEADLALVQLQSLYDISRQLSNKLDVTGILNEAVTYLALTTQARSSMIWLIDAGMLRFEAGYGPLPDNTLSQAISLQNSEASCLLQAIHQRDGVVITSPATAPLDRLLLEQLQVTCLLAIPLTVQDTVIGVATLHGADEKLITKFDLARAIAQQTAIAIKNGQLYEEVQQLNRTLERRIAHRTRELVEEKERLKTILSSIADGVIASDQEDNVLLINPAAEEILAKTDHKLTGYPIRKILEIFKPEGRGQLLRILDTLQAQGRAGEIEADEVREVILEVDKQIINARLTVAFTPTKEAIGVVMVLRDITREVEADRAKSEFISNVSHELRTPMTSIKGYSELMSQGIAGPLTTKQEQFLAIIYRNAERLSLLINDLLDISRIESGAIRLNLKQVYLGDLARQVVDALHVPAQKKGLSLKLSAPPDLPLVNVDGDRIIQVLTNLTGNAIAYTERGEVHVGLRAVANAVEVYVQDTGIGIAPDDLNRVFDRFYRASDEAVQSKSGTGLGLAIVKTFVEMHGGRIWINSEYGRGSTFTFILPALPHSAAPS